MNIMTPAPQTRHWAEAALKAAMLEVFRAEEFTALRLTIARLDREIAEEHRAVLAMEGWIA